MGQGPNMGYFSCLAESFLRKLYVCHLKHLIKNTNVIIKTFFFSFVTLLQLSKAFFKTYSRYVKMLFIRNYDCTFEDGKRSVSMRRLKN